MKFDKKIVKCKSEDIHTMAHQIESEWILCLLRRFKVDPSVIEKAQNDIHFGKNEWRRFLFENYGIRIEKDLATKAVVIRRLNFKTYEDIVLGQWTAPEIIRVQTKEDKYCELHLRYWQIV